MLRVLHLMQHSSSGLFQFSKTLQNIQYESLNYDSRISYSLVHLCCKVIVSDGQFTKQSLKYLPPTLYKLLMSVALMDGRDRAIQMLLTVWPWTTFNLSELISPFHDSINVIYNRKNYHKWLENSFFITSSLINGFISCLSIDSKLALGKLKFLNLEGFPTEDATVCKIAKIILSSYEDFKRSCHPQNRKRAREDFVHNPVVGHQFLKLDLNCIFEEKTSNTDLYTIQVDSSIDAKDTFEALSQLFTSKTITQFPLRLQFSKIDLSACYGNKNIMQLLNSTELQSMPLRGLSLSYNHLTNGGIFETLIVSVLPFHYIEYLDISYNQINLTYNTTLLETFANALSSLNHLKRLNLSNNRLTDCLTTILSKLGKVYIQQHPEFISSNRNQTRRKLLVKELSCGLEYLNISACKLCERDVSYLSHSHHISTLKELDVSQNNMCLFVESMVKLLRAVKRTIYVLDIENCYFNEQQLCSLMPEFYGFSNLKYLNYIGYQVNSRDTYCHLSNLIKLSNLVLVQLSYPADCCEDNSVNTYNATININEKGKMFKQKCQQMLNNEQIGEHQLNIFWN